MQDISSEKKAGAKTRDKDVVGPVRDGPAGWCGWTVDRDGESEMESHVW